jgi:hypothetical protein
MQHLRDEDGSYWTGYVYPDDARWPVERTTWTAGAVLLATAALAGEPDHRRRVRRATTAGRPAEIVADCGDRAPT